MLIYKNRYVPIIPTVLVNGACGIGTGWNTFVPNFDPRDLVVRVRALIEDENAEIEPLVSARTRPPAVLTYVSVCVCIQVPAYKNYGGTLKRIDRTHYECFGRIDVINKDTVEITELPFKRWHSFHQGQLKCR
jgi:DNA topoisomerase-2